MLGRFLTILLTPLLVTTAAQAHAFGERYDLPVPLWLNLVGGAAVVVLSFVIAALFLRPPTIFARSGRMNLPSTTWAWPLTCGAVLFAVRLVSVFLFTIALLAGLIGQPDYARNAAPTIVWVIGWVGLTFASVLLGNIWLLVNPWLILFEWAEALWRKLTARGLSLNLHYPRQFGMLPGILLVISFVWFMLASGVAGDSRAIACSLAVYSVITWTGMFLFGPTVWLAHGEAFSLLFSALARFSPTELRVTDRDICAHADCTPDDTGECSDCVEAFFQAPPEKREINLRPYGTGLVISKPLSLSMTILVLMLLALVAFEGFMDTAQWVNFMVALGELEASDGIHAPLKTTLMFILATALLYALFYVVSALMRLIGYSKNSRRWSTIEITGLFVLSLIPISIAYHVAHYLYWFITQIQFVIPAASDPFAFGWNLFGGRNFVPDRAAISLKVIWHTAVVAIVIGHVIAVYVAHRIALNVFGSRRAALLSQLPMLLLMVVYTMTSLWMLAQPIMG